MPATTVTGLRQDVTATSSAGHLAAPRPVKKLRLSLRFPSPENWSMSDRRIVLFGPFEADLHTGELRRDGRRVHLQQQPFRVLNVLIERPGELVTREELRRTLWRDGTFVSFERGLTSAVRKVREALGERADSPTYIETLPGRGYRFIAPVAAPEWRRGPSELPVSAARRIPASRSLVWAALLILAVTSGGPTAAPSQAGERLAAAELLSAYACLLKSQGKFAEGLEVIRRAHALAPESAKITAEVGFHLHAAGQFDEEFPMLRRAVELDADSPDAWLHLGLAHARRGDFATAIADLERASSLTTTDSRPAQWLQWARSQKL
jgi:DNA-binding winged helix-turn-helix (wHTH) protein